MTRPDTRQTQPMCKQNFASPTLGRLRVSQVPDTTFEQRGSGHSDHYAIRTQLVEQVDGTLLDALAIPVRGAGEAS